MTWGNGGLFVQTWMSTLKQTSGQIMDLDSDSFKVALYNNTPTPNFSDILANCVYLAGQWVTGNEVTSGAAYPAGGVAPGGQALTESPTGTLMWTLAGISQASTTLTSVWGCLIYDNTLATKYAICAVPFGSAYNTTSGTFAITWPVAGIFNIDITP